MASYLEIYDGASLATAITLTLGPGDTSSTYTRALWNDKGAAQSATTATGLRLILEAKDGSTWKRSGLSILDDNWFTIRITSVTNTGDSSFGPYTTGTKRLGANSQLELPDLPADCAYNFELACFAPSTISTTAIEFRLVAVDQENSYGIAGKSGLLNPGVLPAYRDTSLRKVVTGGAITGSGAASVAVAKALIDYDGTRVCVVESSHTLNQNDSAAAALTAGESYIATISVDSAGAVTATKGTKAVSPTAPSVPTDEIFLGYVTVDYQVGGTSIIDQADVDQDALVRSDYYVEAGTGLNVDIHSGSAITTTDHYVFHSGIISTVAVPSNSTSYIWVRPNGTFDDNTTGVAPEDGARLLATAVTDGSAVTSVTDKRFYSDLPLHDHVVVLKKTGAITTTATYCDWTSLPFDAELVDATLEIGDIGTSASGSFIVDVNTIPVGTSSTSGTRTTIYTSQGSADYRPTVAYNASSYRNTSMYHEVRRFTAGTRFSFDVDAVPGTITGNPTDAYVILRFRRYR